MASEIQMWVKEEDKRRKNFEKRGLEKGLGRRPVNRHREYWGSLDLGGIVRGFGNEKD